MLNRAQLGDKVVYQVYIKSFQDSTGNGIGDLRGITLHLDYLQKLGIDLIWINPFYVSPQRDNGYDVADYYAVDPMFGTMDDFDELVREASQRNIGIMVDMVFNHTSTDHEWFKRALEGDEKYLDYYKFVDAEPDATAENPGKPPCNWDSLFGGSAWSYVPQLNKWYLHLFDPSQADLNWDNPEVRKELVKVLRFWKSKGVAGFRFDVANCYSKPAEFKDAEGGDARCYYVDGPHIHEYIQELVREADIEDLMMVGEMSATSIEQCVHYTAPKYHEFNQAFSFDHVETDYQNGKKWTFPAHAVSLLHDAFKRWQEGVAAGGGWNALFMSNHDQPRPNSRFGDVSTRENWLRSSKALATSLHLMRGTPYVFQGEELGMTNPGFTSIDQMNDVESLNNYRFLLEKGISPDEAFKIVVSRSRDNGRTPMQWDDSENAGFTTGTPWMLVAENHSFINAAAEVDDPDSIFSYYRRLIQLRKEQPAIQQGSIRFFDQISEKAIAYERVLDDAGAAAHRIVVAFNLSGDDARALPESAVEDGNVLLENCSDWRTDEGYLVLGPWTVVVFGW